MADYYSVITCAISRVPNETDEARHAVYERARTALQETLGRLDPAILANEVAALDAAIATVETDLLFSVMQGFVRKEAAVSFFERGSSRSSVVASGDRSSLSREVNHLNCRELKGFDQASKISHKI